MKFRSRFLDGGSQLVNPNTHLLEDVLYTVNFQTVGNNLKDLAKIQPNRKGQIFFFDFIIYGVFLFYSTKKIHLEPVQKW